MKHYKSRHLTPEITLQVTSDPSSENSPNIFTTERDVTNVTPNPALLHTMERELLWRYLLHLSATVGALIPNPLIPITARSGSSLDVTVIG